MNTSNLDLDILERAIKSVESTTHDDVLEVYHFHKPSLVMVLQAAKMWLITCQSQPQPDTPAPLPTNCPSCGERNSVYSVGMLYPMVRRLWRCGSCSQIFPQPQIDIDW